MNLGTILEQYAKIVLAVVALGGVVQGVIVVSGGSIPPWAPARDFNNLRERVNGFEMERDANRCADAIRRLKNARMRLQARPSDTFEQENIEVTEMEIRRIPGCRVS